MSWAAVAKSAAPPVAPASSSAPNADERIAVVDTNAIISGLRLEQLADRFCTIPEVLAEVRDKQSRAFLSTLPFSLDVREPDDESVKAVQRFARETGDIHSLSAVDLKLLALAHTLEVAAHGNSNLREHPVQVRTRQKHKSRPRALPGWGNVSNPEDWRVVDEAPEEQLTNAQGGQSRIIAAVQSLALGPDGAVASSPAAEPGSTTTAATSWTALPALPLPAQPAAQAPGDPAASSPAPVTLLTVPLPPAAPEASLAPQPQAPQPGAAGAEGGRVGEDAGGPEDDDGDEEDEDDGGWETATKSRNAARRKQRKARRHQAWLEQQQQHQQQPQQLQQQQPQHQPPPVAAPAAAAGGTGECVAPSVSGGQQLPPQPAEGAAGAALAGASEGTPGADQQQEQQQHQEEGSPGSAGASGERGDHAEGHEQEGEEQEEEEEEGDEMEEVEGLELVTDDGEEEDDGDGTGDGDGGSETGTAVTGVMTEATATAPSVAGLTDVEVLPNTTSNVFTVTADFAMQNVMLQMGLRLVTRDGKQVTRVSRWALRCSACYFVTKEAGRLFCPRCGNMTMDKVEVTVGPGGAEFFGVRKKFILRGTKFSLPKPKGGRGARANPVLREDVLMARTGGLGRQRKGGPGAGKAKAAGELDPFAPEFGSETWHQVASGGRGGGHIGGVPLLLTGWKNNPNEVKPQRKSRRK